MTMGNFIAIIKTLFDGILSIYFMIFDNKIKINLWASKPAQNSRKKNLSSIKIVKNFVK